MIDYDDGSCFMIFEILQIKLAISDRLWPFFFESSQMKLSIIEMAFFKSTLFFVIFFDYFHMFFRFRVSILLNVLTSLMIFLLRNSHAEYLSFSFLEPFLDKFKTGAMLHKILALLTFLSLELGFFIIDLQLMIIASCIKNLILYQINAIRKSLSLPLFSTLLLLPFYIRIFQWFIAHPRKRG